MLERIYIDFKRQKVRICAKMSEIFDFLSNIHIPQVVFSKEVEVYPENFPLRDFE
jgi:hypothetical protein